MDMERMNEELTEAIDNSALSFPVELTALIA